MKLLFNLLCRYLSTKKQRHEFAFFFSKELNVALYYQNPDSNEYYSMVPTSALSGDGMGSLIAQVVQICQKNLSQRLTFTDELQATVMEVRRNLVERIVLISFSVQLGQNW